MSLRPPDIIVPLPYSSNIERAADGRLDTTLSTMSCMAIDAAAALQRTYPTSTIVVPGETCYGLEPLNPDSALPPPNTTDLMVARACDHGGIHPDRVLGLHQNERGEPLNNTYIQLETVAEALRDLLQRQPETRVVLVPLEYHAERVAQVARAFGLGNAEVRTAEFVLDAAGDTSYLEYAPYIAAGPGRLEPSLRAFNRIIDPRGRVLNWITRRRGARQVDVRRVTDGNGKSRMVIEDGYALVKLRRLQEEDAVTDWGFQAEPQRA
jgi:hypothetical protein